MKHPGRPRKLTDTQLQRILEWQSLAELCSELGVCLKTAYRVREESKRRGWVYKYPYQSEEVRT